MFWCRMVLFWLDMADMMAFSHAARCFWNGRRELAWQRLHSELARHDDLDVTEVLHLIPRNWRRRWLFAGWIKLAGIRVPPTLMKG